MLHRASRGGKALRLLRLAQRNRLRHDDGLDRIVIRRAGARVALRCTPNFTSEPRGRTHTRSSANIGAHTGNERCQGGLPISLCSQRNGRLSGSHSLMSPSTMTASIHGNLAQHLQHFSHLEAPLRQAAARDASRKRSPARTFHFDVHFERAARLEAPEAQIVAFDIEDAASREQRVAVFAVVAR